MLFEKLFQFVKKLPRLGFEPGIFWFSYYFALTLPLSYSSIPVGTVVISVVAIVPADVAPVVICICCFSFCFAL
jgi:hypothetical protein